MIRRREVGKVTCQEVPHNAPPWETSADVTLPTSRPRKVTADVPTSYCHGHYVSILASPHLLHWPEPVREWLWDKLIVRARSEGEHDREMITRAGLGLWPLEPRPPAETYWPERDPRRPTRHAPDFAAAKEILEAFPGSRIVSAGPGRGRTYPCARCGRPIVAGWVIDNGQYRAGTTTHTDCKEAP